MTQYTFNKGDVVKSAIEYEVFTAGEYESDQLVECKKISETVDYPTCMFIAYMVAGDDVGTE